MSAATNSGELSRLQRPRRTSSGKAGESEARDAGESRAVGAEAEVVDAAGAAGQFVEKRPRIQVPDQDVGSGSRRNEAAIRTDRDRPDGGTRIEVSAVGLTGRSVPQADGFVVGTGGDASTVGRETDGADAAAMPGEHGDRLGEFGVPEADGAVASGGGDGFAVGGKADTVQTAAMAGQGGDEVHARGRVEPPDADGAVPRA